MQRDPYELRRFVEAQAVNYEEALAELHAGHKETHWSWYVFPQVRGLGSSPTSVRLKKYFEGVPDAATISILGQWAAGAK